MPTKNQGHQVGRGLSLLSIMIAPHRIIVRSLPDGGGCDLDLGQGVDLGKEFEKGEPGRHG
jgi:hypothetical protein